MIGVQLLSQLTCEMNQISEVEANRSLTKHRKIASSFRDTQLFEIFRLSCTLLGTAIENCKNLNFNDENQHGLMTQLLRLAQNCLTFDFIGTSTDESSDDLCTVQIPTSWRPAFLDFTTLKLFFDLYHSLPNTLSSLALSCLVQIASVRRSLFSNTERAKFLTHLVNGVKHILQNPQGLSDSANYHEFCRLLARLKSNYQLGELVMVDNYPEAIQLIAKFTVQSLQMWQFAPNSVHYLLSLWQRMVASVPYVKATEPHLLETYTPEVTNAYITSRLESVAVVVQENLEDPLEDLGMVQQQLEQLSVIGRCEYQKTCTLLVQLFDQAARTYQELMAIPRTSGVVSPTQHVEITVQEGRLTWLVYIIGSAIGGRVSFNSNEEHDTMDGELVCRVLQLMNLTDSRLAQGGCEKLELAMLSFFEQFRKIYVGDQVQKNSKVYRRLSEVLGLNDEATVLSVFIRKIITNLKYWGRSEQIISKTLQLLNDLSVGYSCVRKLVKLEEVQFMLNNHTSEHFPFLGNTVVVTEMRCRSMFYTSLGRLLMVDLGEDEDRFHTFMLPLTASFENIGTMLTAADGPMFAPEDAKKALIGLARDLRGLAFSFNTKTSYMMLFDWIYPNYTPILLRAIELWYHDPQVTTPVLKLFAELVQNRSQRLQFDVSSPNGILLFREASKIICSYGSRILNVEVPKEQTYPLKLKGISICFSMLKAALCGSYVNFGVFRLYGDETLDNALNIFVKLLLSIPQSDLLDYPKLSQTYYVLLECLAQDHMSFLSTLEPQVFLYILSSISEGLTALDTMVCTGCCATLDHIVTYLFKQLTQKVYPGKKQRVGLAPSSDMFLKVLEMHPEILQQILSTVLNVIMFEDCRNQWSMSRPLLGLILLNEDYFNQMRESIIRSQPPDKQAAMVQWFENLMDGIERNLLTKNRDKFTQNLSMFRRDINDSLKGPNVNTSSASDMMTS
jgi:exportin-7